MDNLWNKYSNFNLKKEYIDSDSRILTVYTYFDGTTEYYNSKGLLHRLDGPAVEDSTGYYSWFRNGIYHRIGGPQSCLGPAFLWYINGKEVNIYYIYG